MQKASNIAAISAIAVAVLAVGGVHTSVSLIVATLALLAHGLAFRASLKPGRKLIVSFVGAAFAVASMLCLAQLIPLPGAIHSLLNPTEHELWNVGSKLAGMSNEAWRPLSLDPWETSDRGIRYAALAAIAIWASNLKGRSQWRDFARWFSGLAAVTLCFGAILHFGNVTNLFGLFSPSVGFRGVSPFVSTNHGAVFFGLAAIIAGSAAFALRRTASKEVVLQSIATAVFGITALSHASDGVNMALGATIVVAAVGQWIRKGRPVNAPREVLVGGGLVVALSLVLAVWLDVHLVAQQAVERVLFSGEHGGRLALMSAGLEASGDYWRFGAGAGAVSSVVPATLDWNELLPASIPLVENDPLELVLSFGWPLGLAVLVAFGAQVVLAARRALGARRNPRVAVAVVTAVYLGLVAQLHFPLFALGISLGAVAWFELLVSRRNKTTSGGVVFETGHLVLTTRGGWALTGLLVVSVAACALLHFGMYTDRELGAEPTPERLEQEVWQRPGSHAVYVKLATRALKEGDGERALALADFAITREDSPRLHLYRGQVLAALDDPRAVEEFRLLIANDPSGRTLNVLAATFDEPEPIIEILRDQPDVWEPALVRLNARENPDLVSSVVLGLVAANSDNVDAYRLAARIYLRMKQPVLARLWAELANDLEQKWDGKRVAPLLIAQALRATGDVAGAKAVLDALADDPTLVADARREALKLHRSLGADSAEFIRGHHDVLCASPVPMKDQELCWTTEAWLADADGDGKRAVQLLRLVHRRHGNVRPLAEYYLEHLNCPAIATLARKSDGRTYKVLKSLLTRCNAGRPR